ncbi:MAG: hypothetical protein WCE81_07350 [Halobacteriota archaeon]
MVSILVFMDNALEAGLTFFPQVVAGYSNVVAGYFNGMFQVLFQSLVSHYYR